MKKAYMPTTCGKCSKKATKTLIDIQNGRKIIVCLDCIK